MKWGQGHVKCIHICEHETYMFPLENKMVQLKHVRKRNDHIFMSFILVENGERKVYNDVGLEKVNCPCNSQVRNNQYLYNNYR